MRSSSVWEFVEFCGYPNISIDLYCKVCIKNSPPYWGICLVTAAVSPHLSEEIRFVCIRFSSHSDSFYNQTQIWPGAHISITFILSQHTTSTSDQNLELVDGETYKMWLDMMSAWFLPDTFCMRPVKCALCLPNHSVISTIWIYNMFWLLFNIECYLVLLFRRLMIEHGVQIAAWMLNRPHLII